LQQANVDGVGLLGLRRSALSLALLTTCRLLRIKRSTQLSRQW